ncbi:MAG TPA: hypothetical protein V6C81_20420 [Planktothrix sp.]|jgi:hypothetical protein
MDDALNFPPGTPEQQEYRNELAIFLCVVVMKDYFTDILDKAPEYGFGNIEEIHSEAWASGKLTDSPRDRFRLSLKRQKKAIGFLCHICRKSGLSAVGVLAGIRELTDGPGSAD